MCKPVFQNLPHSYTWPLKKWTHSYTWSSEMLTSSYTALWFLYSFIMWQSIHWIPREQTASKNLWEKNIHIYPDIRKVGPFTHESRKNRASHILFVEKKGLIIYLAALKKGTIWHAHLYYAIYRNLPASFTTTTPPHPHPTRALDFHDERTLKIVRH